MAIRGGVESGRTVLVGGNFNCEIGVALALDVWITQIRFANASVEQQCEQASYNLEGTKAGLTTFSTLRCSYAAVRKTKRLEAEAKLVIAAVNAATVVHNLMRNYPEGWTRSMRQWSCITR